jgi:Uma2 family endonuclease
MSAVLQKLITAEEFLYWPEAADGSRQELVRGEVVTVSPGPGGMHGVVCMRTGALLFRFIEAMQLGHVSSNDSGFLTEHDPDTVRGPDLAYWSKERLPTVPVGYAKVAPNLAVEVLSPGNRPGEMRDKLREYFAAGVELVWLVAPQDRTVTVYTRPEEGQLLHEEATLTGGSVLPVFSCKVGDLFPR